MVDSFVTFGGGKVATDIDNSTGIGTLKLLPSQTNYTLASNATINAAAASTPITAVRGRVYVWEAQWTGAGTLALQALGSDGVTWRDVATLAAPGTFAGEIRIGESASLRLFNKNSGGGTNFTAVYSSIS